VINYIKTNNADQCIGFIHGINKALEFMDTKTIDNLELNAVKLSAELVLLEKENKKIFDRWYQLKAELKAIENRILPEMNFQIY